uniref:DUF6285 domain-containing protein n=1 Tax=Parastrongyloides trichosuri TaxID=131310 RepID=A0A0N4Z3R7_PARTI
MHIAIQARDEAHMLEMQQRIRSHGVSCLGPVEHHFVRSVYIRSSRDERRLHEEEVPAHPLSDRLPGAGGVQGHLWRRRGFGGAGGPPAEAGHAVRHRRHHDAPDRRGRLAAPAGGPGQAGRPRHLLQQPLSGHRQRPDHGEVRPGPGRLRDPGRLVRRRRPVALLSGGSREPDRDTDPGGRSDRPDEGEPDPGGRHRPAGGAPVAQPDPDRMDRPFDHRREPSVRPRSRTEHLRPGQPEPGALFAGVRSPLSRRPDRPQPPHHRLGEGPAGGVEGAGPAQSRARLRPPARQSGVAGAGEGGRAGAGRDVANHGGRHDPAAVEDPLVAHHFAEAAEVAQLHVEPACGEAGAGGIDLDIGVALHPHRLPEAVAEHLGQGLAADARDQPAHDLGVDRLIGEGPPMLAGLGQGLEVVEGGPGAVVVRRTRHRAPGAQEGDDVGVRVGIDLGIGKARGHIHHLAHGGVAKGAVGQFGDVAPHRRVAVELALGDQHGRRRTGEGLAHRMDDMLAIRRKGAEIALIDDLAPVQDDDAVGVVGVQRLGPGHRGVAAQGCEPDLVQIVPKAPWQDASRFVAARNLGGWHEVAPVREAPPKLGEAHEAHVIALDQPRSGLGPWRRRTRVRSPWPEGRSASVSCERRLERGEEVKTGPSCDGPVWSGRRSGGLRLVAQAQLDRDDPARIDHIGLGAGHEGRAEGVGRRPFVGQVAADHSQGPAVVGRGDAQAQVHLREAFLIGVGAEVLFQVGSAAAAHGGVGQQAHAVVQRMVDVQRHRPRPFRRARQAGAADVLHTARRRGDAVVIDARCGRVGVVFGVVIGQRARQADGWREAERALHLDALAFGVGGVGGDEGVDRGIVARHLQVVELGRIGRQVQRRPAIQQRQLGADLDRLRGFALELEGVLAAGRLGADEAAGLRALCVGGVEHQVAIDHVLDLHRWIELAFATLAAQRGVQPGRRHRPHDGAGLVGGLVLPGLAQAGEGVALVGLLEPAIGAAVERPHQDVGPLVHVDLVPVRIGADNPGQGAFIGRGQAHFLRDLVELLLEDGAQQRRGGEVAVDLLVVVEGRIGGDRGQGHAVGEILVDRQHAVEAVGVVIVRRALCGRAREGLGAAGGDGAHRLAGQLLAGAFQLQPEGEGVAGQIVDDGAADQILAARIVVAGGRVLEPALVVAVFASQADQQLVRDRAGDDLGDLEAVVAVDRAGDSGRELTLGARAVGGDVDGAGGGVLAEQGALCAAQYFDAGHVQEGGGELAAATGVGAVDEQADRLLKGQVARRRADAADVDGVVARRGLDVQVRHRARQGFQVAHVLAGQFLAAGDVDRDRHVLQAFGALARRDQDIGDGGGVGLVRRRHGRFGLRHGGRAENEAARCEQHDVTKIGAALARFAQAAQVGRAPVGGECLAQGLDLFGPDAPPQFAGQLIDDLLGVLTHGSTHGAIAAEQLQAFVDALQLGLGDPQFGDGGGGRVQFAQDQFFGAGVDEAAGDHRLGLDVGQGELCVLELHQRLAEGVALARVVDSQLQRPFQDGQPHGGDAQTLLRQHGHQLAEALALGSADQVRRRDAHVLEEQLGGVLRVAAHLVEVPAPGEAGAVALHRNQGDAARAVVRGAAHHQDQVRRLAVGDEGLLAVQHPFVALKPGAGADALQVRSRPRLGHGDGQDDLARDHLGQPSLLLLLGAEGDDVGGHDHVVQRHAPALHAARAELLDQHALVAEVSAHAAVLFRNRQAQQAELGALGPHLALDDLVAVPGFDLFRRAFSVEEFAKALAEQVDVFLGIGLCGHQSSHVRIRSFQRRRRDRFRPGAAERLGPLAGSWRRTRHRPAPPDRGRQPRNLGLRRAGRGGRRGGWPSADPAPSRRGPRGRGVRDLPAAAYRGEVAAGRRGRRGARRPAGARLHRGRRPGRGLCGRAGGGRDPGPPHRRRSRLRPGARGPGPPVRRDPGPHPRHRPVGPAAAGDAGRAGRSCALRRHLSQEQRPASGHGGGAALDGGAPARAHRAASGARRLPQRQSDGRSRDRPDRRSGLGAGPPGRPGRGPGLAVRQQLALRRDASRGRRLRRSGDPAPGLSCGGGRTAVGRACALLAGGGHVQMGGGDDDDVPHLRHRRLALGRAGRDRAPPQRMRSRPSGSDGGLAMIEGPRKDELLEATAAWLNDAASPAEGFHRKVAANALGIVTRELTQWPAAEAAAVARMQAILGRDGDYAALNLALAEALRDGTVSADDAVVRAIATNWRRRRRPEHDRTGRGLGPRRPSERKDHPVHGGQGAADREGHRGGRAAAGGRQLRQSQAGAADGRRRGGDRRLAASRRRADDRPAGDRGRRLGCVRDGQSRLGRGREPRHGWACDRTGARRRARRPGHDFGRLRLPPVGRRRSGAGRGHGAAPGRLRSAGDRPGRHHRRGASGRGVAPGRCGGRGRAAPAGARAFP